MEATEITKVIDGVYKNILESFNPASRQMISTGKAYLKSLHGASAASSLYLDTLVRLSRQAQQSTLGNSNDIGTSLIQITEVFKEIHAQQLNTLKAFYVDFLVPLETNLEKDTRVIQTEQKKFLMCHKQRMESYNKAASIVKKYRKKSKKNATAQTLDKEIKVMQNLEEERSKLEAFCDKSIKDALTQERRRYGFILERQASLAKHYLAFYTKGNSLLNVKVENWMKTAKSREMLPESMQHALLKRIQGGDEEECIYCSPRVRTGACGNSADDTASICSQLRKTKSMDAGEIINLQSEQSDLQVTSTAGTMSRAKSDLNLMMNGGGNGGDRGMGGNSGGTSGAGEQLRNNGITTRDFGHDALDVAGNQSQMPGGVAQRPKSLAVATETTNSGYAKALYAYLSSGENQLSFLEGDIIALIGERNKGWQFGENLRTQKTGWFPVAYTEMDISTPAMEMIIKSNTMPASGSSGNNNQSQSANSNGTNGSGNGSSNSPVPPPMPATVPLPPSVISMNNINSQQSKGLMTHHGHGHGHSHSHSHSLGHGHLGQNQGTYSPTSSSNSSSSTFHQKRLNLADVIVHRTPEQMMSHPTTPSAISNNKSITSPITPTAGGGREMIGANNNLIGPGGMGQSVNSRGGQGQGRDRGDRDRHHGGATTPACPSDSLHSSNDSGFSNDLNSIANAVNRGNGAGAAINPPPQPDIDYSDDEPQQNSNRRKNMNNKGPLALEKTTPPQSGDKWLMDRYHMSESIRIGGLGIGGITRRRSLSFSNVSGVGVGSLMRTNPRAPSHDRDQNRNNNSSNNNGNNYSPYPSNRYPGPHPPPANYRRRDPSHERDAYDNKESGPFLKKFLNRTKSLIWKRQTEHMDSLSHHGSQNSLELWGSHNSLIEARFDEFEMKPLNRSPSIKAPSSHLYDDNDTIKDENIQDDDGETIQDELDQDLDLSLAHQKENMKNQQQHSNSKLKAVPPPLPPFPANLRGLHGFNVKNSNNHSKISQNSFNNVNVQKSNKATSTSNSLKSDSPTPIIPHHNNRGHMGLNGHDDLDTLTISGRDNESCIFISDHMRHKGSQRSTRKSTKSSTKSSNINGTKKSVKSSRSNHNDNDDDDIYDEQDDLSLSMNGNGHGHGKKGQVSRMESFTEFEAPIIPVAKKNKSGNNNRLKNGQQSQQEQQLVNGHSARSNNNNNVNNNNKKLKNKNNVTKMGLNATSNNNHSQNQSQISVSRSYIVEKSRKFSYNSNEEDDEVPVDVDEYEVDEEVIDFDDDEEENDVDNSSSVFMEAERDLDPRNDTYNDPEQDIDDEDETDMSLPHSLSLPPVETPKSHNNAKVNGNGHLNGVPPSMIHRSASSKSQGKTSGGNRTGSSSYGNGLINVNGNKMSSKSMSSKHQPSNGLNGDNIYNHSTRFAPIVPYNGNVNGGGNNGKTRMSSPAPPPPPHANVNGNSNGMKSSNSRSSSEHRQEKGRDRSGHGNGNGSSSRRNASMSSGQSGHRMNGSRPATIKGSIRSEFHTVELIATTDGGSGGAGSGHGGNGNPLASVMSGKAPTYDYADHIHRRLYLPERNSRLDQKSESGHRYGPWYDLHEDLAHHDLWDVDQPVTCK